MPSTLKVLSYDCNKACPLAPPLIPLQESWRRVDVDDASECALTREEDRGVRAIETRAMDVAAEIGHEHAAALGIEGQPAPPRVVADVLVMNIAVQDALGGRSPSELDALAA